jgi:multicomponent Na+:H+ antiporter subunit B
MNREDTTVIARTSVRLVVPIILVTAIALLLQGHNLPGGGFIGGTLTVTAVGLIYIIFGLDYLERTILDVNLRPDVLRPALASQYQYLFAVGLAVAAGSGIAAIFLAPAVWGYEAAFLEQGFVILHHVPLYQELELASAIVFDLGVYFVVVGALLTILGVVGGE